METQHGFLTAQVLTTDYVYDSLDRLEGYTEMETGGSNSVTTHAFSYYPSYDRATQRVERDGTLLKNRSYQYDETYWLTGITETAGAGGSIAYQYDANGNTTHKTDTTGGSSQRTLFSYNSRNQLKQVATGTPGAEVGQGSHDYNYAGMRIRHLGSERGDIEYVYDGQSILDELHNNSTSLVAHYRYGDRLLSLNSNGADQFYHYASLGTTANLTNAQGEQQVAYRTDPFGEITQQEGESVNRHIFTGQEHDEKTGLIYFGARFYDPDTARFINQDTYLGESTTPPSLHRYLYAYANPTVYVDPDGHSVLMYDSSMAGWGELIHDDRMREVARAQRELEQRATAPMAAGLAVQTVSDTVSGAVGGVAYLRDALLSPISNSHRDSLGEKTAGFVEGVGALIDSRGKVIVDGVANSLTAASAQVEAGNYYRAGKESAPAAQITMGALSLPFAVRSAVMMARNGGKPELTSEQSNLDNGGGQGAVSQGNSVAAQSGVPNSASTGRSALNPTEAMGNRLNRFGYDDANTARIMQSIEGGEQVVIVGENMRRVNAVARMVDNAGGQSVTYAPRNWNGMNRNSLEANRSWIRYWAKDKGVTTIDIGRQPTIRPDGPSPFYGIENRSLNKWGIYTPFDQ